ncbi:MAG: F0F1 ATP synthase subunit gamma [Verrucomicrobiota bacterium]|jgi:F-type H+-transporting ATPase subunit gamma|nr:F0F1 ATP synthase subunit gamma [Verrucomicrobiota bacterium]
MASFREYSVKLAAMGGMRRVTATMKMVAASHLHRAQNELHLPEPFAVHLRLLSRIARLPRFAGHRLCTPPPAGGSVRLLLLVMCSDRGLCGAFNSSIIREVRRWYAEQVATRGARGEALYVGQKGFAALRNDIPPCARPAPVMSAHPNIKETVPISTVALDSFLAGQYDEVWIAGNRVVSAMTHQVKRNRILPYDPTRAVLPPDAQPPPPLPGLLEPADARLLETLVRLWVHDSVYFAQLNRTASEQAARVMAMENATVNLRRMEKDLLLWRNRARQAAITNELNEIVSGAETLG